MSLPTFHELTAGDQNTSDHNDAVHRLLTNATWSDPLLAEHRKHVEENKLGFGDAAFHAMWSALLTEAATRFGQVRALEIGIFKGQVISLWSLLAKTRGLNLQVSALGPLAGQPRPVSRFRLLNSLRYRLDRRYREQIDNANYYDDADYEGIVRRLFERYQMDFNQVRLLRGFSTDPDILRKVEADTYHLIYVDGDHSYDGAMHDFRTFGPKVVPGGWLIADDAGGDLPGTVFWKGHEAVSRAVRTLPSHGFRNVLNVGHNRVYERLPSA